MWGEIIVLPLAQMRVSPDEGNIKLAGNGLQLNTAQGNRWREGVEATLRLQEAKKTRARRTNTVCTYFRKTLLLLLPAETKHVGKLVDV